MVQLADQNGTMSPHSILYGMVKLSLKVVGWDWNQQVYLWFIVLYRCEIF